VWLATLLGLLIFWVVDEKRAHYASMGETQYIAYISDVGASRLKPLFVAGCVVTTVLLDASFAADRWLRHRGRLVPNATTTEKVLSGLTIFFALVGTAGLILLSVFDTLRHPKLHDIFLLFFIVGYVFSAIFICWEYQRLGTRYREHRVLRISFWIKLLFVVVEILLAIGFVACTFTQNYNPGAVLEWIIAFIFCFYVFSFYVDLYPAVHTKGGSRAAAAAAKQPGAYRPATAGGGRGGGGGGGPVGYMGARQMEEAASCDDRNLVAVPPAAFGSPSYYHQNRIPGNF